MPQYGPLMLRQLKTAMSSASMVEILRRDLEYPKRRGLILMDCQAVRVYPREGKEFVLEYEMQFLDGNRERHQRVFGELVGEAAEKRYEELLRKLRKKKRGQLPPNGPTDLVTCLPDLGLILRFPGLDEQLLGLKVALDPVAMRSILSQYLPLDGSEVTGCVSELLGHRLGKRCVIRYHLESLDPKTGEKIHRSLIGKVYKSRGNRGMQVFTAMRGLWEQGFGDGAPDRVRIPKPLAYVPDRQLLLMEDVHGSALAALEGSEIERAIETAGMALAKLHRCSLKVPGRYTPRDEVALLADWVTVISQVHPGMKTALEKAFAEVRNALDRCLRFEPTLVHRDFYEKQVLVGGLQTTLIDFDTLCLSDPAIDLGNFLAHLRLAGLQRLGNVKRLEEAFLAAYRPWPSGDLPVRVEAYTKSSLLRLACLYSLWPQWNRLAEPLLEALT